MTMAATTPNEAKISLKLMVHKQKKRVIFAEADNHFVDILFSFMTLPMGTIVRLLEKIPDQKVKPLGSLQNLYQSLIDLPVNTLSTEESKLMMLNPRSSLYEHCRNLILKIDDTEPTKYFTCEKMSCIRHSDATFSTCNGARCSLCGNHMTREMNYRASTTATDTGGSGVFVTNITTFIVTDDLRVMPNSSSFSIQLLCDAGITNASELEERTFDVGHDQILILLKMAILSSYPLTDLVFSRTHYNNIPAKHKQETLMQDVLSSEIDANSKRMRLKVTLQKSNSKFLFAEVEREFVDFLFGFLEIPLGTVVGKLMNGNSSVVSLDNLFASMARMDVGYIMSQGLKDMLLQPQLAWNHVSQNEIFSVNVSKASQVYCRRYVYVNSRFAYLTNSTKSCQEPVRCQAITFKNPREHGSLLKPLVRLMLTDDFAVTPVSSISTILMLNKLKVPLSDIEEHEVSIGIEEGLRILKASLKSRSPLSDALLKGNNQNS